MTVATIISTKVSPTHKGADSRGCIVGSPRPITSKRERAARARTIEPLVQPRAHPFQAAPPISENGYANSAKSRPGNGFSLRPSCPVPFQCAEPPQGRLLRVALLVQGIA